MPPPARRSLRRPVVPLVSITIVGSVRRLRDRRVDVGPISSSSVAGAPPIYRRPSSVQARKWCSAHSGARSSYSGRRPGSRPSRACRRRRSAARELGVHEDDPQAELGGGEAGVEEAAVVAAQDRDAVAGADAWPSQARATAFERRRSRRAERAELVCERRRVAPADRGGAVPPPIGPRRTDLGRELDRAVGALRGEQAGPLQRRQRLAGGLGLGPDRAQAQWHPLIRSPSVIAWIIPRPAVNSPTAALRMRPRRGRP